MSTMLDPHRGGGREGRDSGMGCSGREGYGVWRGVGRMEMEEGYVGVGALCVFLYRKNLFMKEQLNKKET